MIHDDIRSASGSIEGTMKPSAKNALVLYSETPDHYEASAPSEHVYENPFRSPRDHDYDHFPSSHPPALPSHPAAHIEKKPVGIPDGAAEEQEAGQKKHKRKMHPLLQGIVVLTVGPFLMAGAVVFAAGSLVYGTGQILVGVGDIMTGGPLKVKARRAWKRHQDARKAR